MKNIIKFLLLLSIFSSSLFAEIDERQIDLYFANGMFGNSKKEEKTTFSFPSFTWECIHQ